MHKKGASLQISKHPRVVALAKQYADRIKALKEEQESQITNLYVEFHEQYECLKRQLIEAQNGKASADSLHNSSADRLTDDSHDKSTPSL